MAETQTLKKVEGKTKTTFEDVGYVEETPTKGRPLRFLHSIDKSGQPQSRLITSPIREITTKKTRTIVKTENSTYSLESTTKK